MSKFKTASAMMQEWEEASKRMQTEAEIRADERRKVLEEVISTINSTRIFGGRANGKTLFAKTVNEWIKKFEHMKGEVESE